MLSVYQTVISINDDVDLMLFICLSLPKYHKVQSKVSLFCGHLVWKMVGIAEVLFEKFCKVIVLTVFFTKCLFIYVCNFLAEIIIRNVDLLMDLDFFTSANLITRH